VKNVLDERNKQKKCVLILEGAGLCTGAKTSIIQFI